MYCISPQLMKIPRGITAVRKFPSFGNTVNFVPPTVNKSLFLPRGDFNNDKRNQDTTDNFRKYSYKYMCYSILFATTTYASYKIWLVLKSFMSIY